MANTTDPPKIYEKTLEETATWAVAVVCIVILVISIGLEKGIHKIGNWFKNKHKHTLYEALEKLKAELMLLGFISLLLTIVQTPISNLCIPKSVSKIMRPCTKKQYDDKAAEKALKEKLKNGGKWDGRLLLELAESYIPRRSLATKGHDKCADKGKVAFVSAYGIHQLHVFIFVLAVVHVIYCVVTYALGKTKMKKWKQWENETQTAEYKYSNDPGRFRFARDTTFGRRHLNFWSKTTVTLWIVCFFRQFFGSVTKVDYLALRHGFIMKHFSSTAPGSEKTTYNFEKYIQRSLEQDFKTVVEIKPVIWFVAVLFLLTNSSGLYSYLWSPFIPLVVLIIVGTKLQVIITKLGLRIQEKGDVVIGVPVVHPCDDLFWFDSPELILFLIHLVLFTNAFQLAFFAWSTYEFKLKNCFHESNANVVIRLVVGVIVQIQCSYMTLPLYALVTQMGSKIKPTVFNERVSKVLKEWHHTAKEHTVHGRHSESNTPYSSRPTTPTHGSSPIHLLHNVKNRSVENFPNNPDADNHDRHQFWDPESQHPEAGSSTHHSTAHESSEKKSVPASVELPPIRTSKSSSDFAFK